ncbi:Omp28-related outer membrane protein [Flavobacterium antarcticum]|uniref:Omp28-related outer membrane protein n=1 Tax=Flavobacterium antarcticum TaxID=271155 RepID=UPI0003B3A5D5|nr:Omp28-related outer membrane protein [Flavobacterium antarcticum]
MKILKFLFLSIFFVALYSCSSSEDNGGPAVEVTSITITPSMATQTVGVPTTFTVKTEANLDVTATSVISVVGVNAPLTNASFSPNAAGIYTVKANYSGKTASTTVTYVDGPSTSFVKRVLIEDYTGTWCGFCPRVAQGIDLVMSQTDYAVPVAIHRSGGGAQTDPYHFAAASPLLSLIGLTGYPDARLNRITKWSGDEATNSGQVISFTQGTAPKVGLAMKATVANGTVNLTVKTQFGKNMTGTKLVVYALENGLIYDQVNYTSHYGGGSTIVGFQHNHVLRATYTNILGDEIPAGESVYENTYTKTYSLPVPANVTNASKMEFVAFVVGSDNKAMNVRKAVSGDDQTFEIVE